jgi:hypothetical protein
MRSHHLQSAVIEEVVFHLFEHHRNAAFVLRQFDSFDLRWRQTELLIQLRLPLRRQALL